MLGLHFKMKLLLLFALLVRCSKCRSLTSQEKEHPNLDSAMVGFDPFVANAYGQFDFGFKNKLFASTGEVYTPKHNSYSFPNEFVNYFSCDLQFTSTVLTNFSQYKREKDARFSIVEEDNTYNNYLKDVSEYGLEEDMEDNSIRNFFLETDGEIVQSKITCITQEVAMPSFARPAFAADFDAALRTLHLAAENSKSEFSKKIYRKFVDAFGTHFPRKTKMGAEIIFQKMFAEKELNNGTEKSRQNCINILARRSIHEGSKSVESIISDFSDVSKICNYFSGDNDYFQNSGISSTRVIINGPPPTGSLEDWNAEIEKNPVAIYLELEKISSLLPTNWPSCSTLACHGSNLYNDINSGAVHNFIEERYSTLCQVKDGKRCLPETLSCAADSDCPPGATCKKTLDALSEYKCTPSLDFGVILTCGRNSDSTQLSDVESINTWQLPNLPDAVSSPTLSQIGSILYNCGGLRQNDYTSDCYTLDLTSHTPEWESSSNMPAALAAHTAVTIGSHIWFTFKNRLYDFNTIGQLFRTYDLPMAVSIDHCAVSNNTHSYIIGAGPEKNEIWVNKHSSRPEEWLLVAHISAGKDRQGCLWFKDNVFIAGGERGGKATDEVELFNTETNIVNATSPLLTGRSDAGMFLLGGEPAVVGGKGTAGVLDTIETFNFISSTWTTNSRKLSSPKQFFGLVQLSGI